MAYKLEFENNGRGVVLTYSDESQGAEMIESVIEMYRRDSEHKLRYQIIDFSKLDKIQISDDELHVIASLDQDAARDNPGQVVAMVGTPALFQGMDRRYAVYAEVWSGFETEFFTTMDEARRWVANVYPE